MQRLELRRTRRKSLSSYIIFTCLIIFLFLNTFYQDGFLTQADKTDALKDYVEEEKKTFHHCMEEYESSKRKKFELGKSVWIDEGGVRLICSILSSDMSVLEYGAGGSTTMFSRFVKSWLSVEHNSWWADTVNHILASQGLSHKTRVVTVPTDLPYNDSLPLPKRGDGSVEQFHSYINYPSGQYDLIIDDGRARVAVSQAALDKKLLKSKDSFLVVHDWERKMYKTIVSKIEYRIMREDLTSRRHLAVLQPPESYKP